MDDEPRVRVNVPRTRRLTLRFRLRQSLLFFLCRLVSSISLSIEVRTHTKKENTIPGSSFPPCYLIFQQKTPPKESTISFLTAENQRAALVDGYRDCICSNMFTPPWLFPEPFFFLFTIGSFFLFSSPGKHKSRSTTYLYATWFMAQRQIDRCLLFFSVSYSLKSTPVNSTLLVHNNS